MRNGVEATQGAVIVSDGEPLRPESPTAVMALVCRSHDEKRDDQAGDAADEDGDHGMQYPLWPAGHLPHRGGEKIGRASCRERV